MPREGGDEQVGVGLGARRRHEQRHARAEGAEDLEDGVHEAQARLVHGHLGCGVVGVPSVGPVEAVEHGGVRALHSLRPPRAAARVQDVRHVFREGSGRGGGRERGKKVRPFLRNLRQS